MKQLSNTKVLLKRLARGDQEAVASIVENDHLEEEDRDISLLTPEQLVRFRRLMGLVNHTSKTEPYIRLTEGERDQLLCLCVLCTRHYQGTTWHYQMKNFYEEIRQQENAA